MNVNSRNTLVPVSIYVTLETAEKPHDPHKHPDKNNICRVRNQPLLEVYTGLMVQGTLVNGRLDQGGFLAILRGTPRDRQQVGRISHPTFVARR